jgi:flagellar protein FlaG
MDVKSIGPTDRATTKPSSRLNTGSTSEVMPEALVKQDQLENIRNSNKQEKNPEQITEDELLPITRELNKFMSYLNADIQFELHEKTQRLMVKVVDVKENKVLREFPPKELLDHIANMREYIGVLLDKKA